MLGSAVEKLPPSLRTITADRRSILAGFIGAAVLPRKGFAATSRPCVAITIDDFDLTDSTMMDGEERDQRIREALKERGLKGGGFVAGKYITAQLGQRACQNWSNEGHLLGNHSYSHTKFTGDHAEELMSDVLRCEALLSPYEGFRKFFRFPYLAEGQTAEGRDRMRALLKQHSYRNAHVTIDTSDWFIDNRLRAALKVDPGVDISRFRAFYLDHILDRATYYRNLSRQVFGYDIKHTLLIHHRLTTALFLGGLLRHFEANGWQLIDAAVALDAPEFALEPNSLPAGQSLVWAAAKASGRFENSLRYPGEDGVYEEPKMSALGL